MALVVLLADFRCLLFTVAIEMLLNVSRRSSSSEPLNEPRQ